LPISSRAKKSPVTREYPHFAGFAARGGEHMRHLLICHIAIPHRDFNVC